MMEVLKPRGFGVFRDVERMREGSRMEDENGYLTSTPAQDK